MGINIEPIDLKHVDGVQRLASDPAIGATSNVPSPYPAGGAAWWVRETVKRREAGTEYIFAVLAGANFVGVCGLIEVAGGSGELGYWIGRPFWGHGYATEAARLVLRFGFDHLGLEKITALCLERNPASYRVLEKVGMRFVRWQQNTNPKWDLSERDAYFAITKDEWRGARS
jgi:ribosomal-protein-alanine N-acetyltransferase